MIENIAQAIKKPFDLQERTYLFAKDVRTFCKQLPKTIVSMPDISQLVRSSGSIGANYIEANEALSQKDHLMRLKFLGKKPKKAFIGSSYSRYMSIRRWSKSGSSCNLKRKNLFSSSLR